MASRNLGPHVRYDDMVVSLIDALQTDDLIFREEAVNHEHGTELLSELSGMIIWRRMKKERGFRFLKVIPLRFRQLGFTHVLN